MLLRLAQRIPRPLRLLAVIFWILAIPAASLLPAYLFPDPGRLGEVPGFDKVVHAILYGVLTALLLWIARRPPTLRAHAVAAAGAAIYGLLMEWLQHFTPGRTMDPLDALANTLGATLVAGLAYLLARRRQRKGQSETG